MRNGDRRLVLERRRHEIAEDRRGDGRAGLVLAQACCGLSKPTKTPTARSGEKPTNQVSFESLVVPVLPASGLPTDGDDAAGAALTTPCIIETI